MKTWTPILLAIGISVLLLLSPLVMAELGVSGWMEAGWTMYFLLVPAAIALIVAGAIWSLILYFKRKNA